MSLAVGIADAGVSLRYETFLRPEELRWSDWIERQTDRINAALDALETDCDEELADVNLASIAAAAVLGYLDFRWPDWGWRDGRPGITAFYANFAERTSMKATMPE